jgi:hypothetical protein
MRKRFLFLSLVRRERENVFVELHTIRVMKVISEKIDFKVSIDPITLKEKKDPS